MKSLILMTGPHPASVRIGKRIVPSWHVCMVGKENRPLGTVYFCLSYRRAPSLSCDMARDRGLFLHMDAVPR